MILKWGLKNPNSRLPGAGRGCEQDRRLPGSCSKSGGLSVATLVPGQREWVESPLSSTPCTPSLHLHPRQRPGTSAPCSSNRGFQLPMPGRTWLRGGGGNSPSVPPSPPPSPPHPPPASSPACPASLFLLGGCGVASQRRAAGAQLAVLV